MRRMIATRLVCSMTLVSLAVVFAVVEHPVVGADRNAPMKKAAGKKGRRLPAHYGQVVNEKQREEIYRIEEEYQPQIETLQKELNALKKVRDEKISALLTAEQKKRIEEAATKARENRKSKKQATTKRAEQAPPTPPSAQSLSPKVPAAGK
jgi:Spy/CpxP family protein refolding chaperone